MDLVEFSCAAYKTFRDPLRLEIRPLTLFVGKNNAGKSALVRLPILLARALSAEAKDPIDLKVGEVEFGTGFRDLIHRRRLHGENLHVIAAVRFGESTSFPTAK